ncbi:MAG: restriction endonuclease [Butyrivibrio sp.]|uniref:type II restriction endonuclease n=1 Tax=Butyrivibrio sp. TaxID=28121 RepID=UPI001B17A480|nr:type II restriction endonuclease [Butyrivibrio sp.]MBO6240623.1 restriction endonuclease [Butyrivibrio sp.]
MEAGYLNQYFKAVAVKRLSAVEADAAVSNQHEYNGVSLLKKMFGTDEQKISIPTHFIYVTDDDSTISADGELTWYDARFNHPTRTEWRLYYPTNTVTESAVAEDSLFICLKADGTVLEIIARKDSIIENQLFWLFDVRPDENPNQFVAKTDMTSQPSDKVSFTARMILYAIGVETQDDKEDYTDMLVAKFGNAFPSTREFSKFARETVEADPLHDPDGALLLWFDREEKMFKCMERYLIQERLMVGFKTGDDVDVDAFIQFSLSVNNRRKSRAGLSFENHLEALFAEHKIRYSHTPVTENKSKPDFIFPSIDYYRDVNYPATQLTMLGAKTTAKDRWRQVLEEADRIERKHLITLEGAISENQTNEMISRKLQLVVPKEIHATYSEKQQSWLYSVEDFLGLVKERQIFADGYKNG